MTNHHCMMFRRSRHRHDAPHRVAWQERRLAFEPVEERVLLSANPVVGPQLPTLQTLNVAALTGTNASQATARVWADADGFLPLSSGVGSGYWDYACSRNDAFCEGIVYSVADNVVLGTGKSTSLNLAAAVAGGTLHLTDAIGSLNGNVGQVLVITVPIGPVSVPPAQPSSDAPHQVARLPEPGRVPMLRITEADLQTTARQAGLIDTTPRQSERHLLAMAQTAYRQGLLAAQAAGVGQPVGMPVGAESPQLHDVRLDVPTPADAQPLNGERGRAQAFDLAMLPTPAATPAELAETPAIEAISPEVMSRIEAIILAPESSPAPRDTASDANESTLHDAVFAEMSDSSTLEGPARLDVVQSRRAMAMLVMVLLATELAPRPDRLDEGGTYLYPLPRRNPVRKRAC